MCQKQHCLYLGLDNTEAYYEAYTKLVTQVTENNTSRKTQPYYYYVKKIHYKKTGKVGLVLGKQFQFIGL